MQVKYKKSWFAANISLYLGKKQDRVSYYGTPQELVCHLSNGAIFNDLEVEPPMTQISRARHYSMLNIPETVQDRDIVTIEY